MSYVVIRHVGLGQDIQGMANSVDRPHERLDLIRGVQCPTDFLDETHQRRI